MAAAVDMQARPLHPGLVVAPILLCDDLSADTFATDVDGCRVMEQPVQDRCRNNRVAKDRTPVSIALLEVRMMLPRS